MRNTVWWVWIFSFLRNESGLDEWRCIGALLLWELPKFGGKGCCLGGSEFGLELSLERLAISRSPPIREDYMSEGGREVLLFFDLNQSWADNLYACAFAVGLRHGGCWAWWNSIKWSLLLQHMYLKVRLDLWEACSFCRCRWHTTIDSLFVLPRQLYLGTRILACHGNERYASSETLN